jgi:hypothetical protein
MKNYVIKQIGIFVLAACALGAGHAAQAGTQHVSITTGALNGLGTYYVEFTLTDGSGLGNGNSFAGVSNFSINGGVLGAVLPPTLGDVSGALGGANTLGLADTNAGTGGLADFAQGFTINSATGTITFDLTLAGAGVEPVTPDAFTFQLLDGSFTPIATSGPVGSELVASDFTTLTPTATGYHSDGVYEPSIVATLTPITAVPEPGAFASLALGAFALSALLLCGRRRSHMA